MRFNPRGFHSLLPAIEIADAFPISAQAVSQHLKVLRETRLVRMEKHAQQRIYQVDLDSVRMIETWARNIEQLCHERFVSLTALIAEEKGKVGAKGKTNEQIQHRHRSRSAGLHGYADF